VRYGGQGESLEPHYTRGSVSLSRGACWCLIIHVESSLCLTLCERETVRYYVGSYEPVVRGTQRLKVKLEMGLAAKAPALATSRSSSRQGRTTVVSPFQLNLSALEVFLSGLSGSRDRTAQVELKREPLKLS
jgi:hypothetical protein